MPFPMQFASALDIFNGKAIPWCGSTSLSNVIAVPLFAERCLMTDDGALRKKIEQEMRDAGAIPHRLSGGNWPHFDPIYVEHCQMCKLVDAAVDVALRLVREAANKLVSVLSDLHNAWEFEVKTEKQFDGLMHAAIQKAVKERDAIRALACEQPSWTEHTEHVEKQEDCHLCGLGHVHYTTEGFCPVPGCKVTP